MRCPACWLVALLVAANAAVGAAWWTGWSPPGASATAAPARAEAPLRVFGGSSGGGACLYRWPVESASRAEALARALREQGVRATHDPGEPIRNGYELHLTGPATLQEARAKRRALAAAAGYHPATVDWPLAARANGGTLRLYRHRSRPPLADLQQHLAAQGVTTELVPMSAPGRAEVRVHGPLSAMQEDLLRGRGLSDCHLRPD